MNNSIVTKQDDLFINSFNLINEFFLIRPQDENSDEKIFSILHEIIPYKSAYIFYINPENIKLQYSYNSILNQSEYKISPDLRTELFNGIYSDKLTSTLNTKDMSIIEPLAIKETIFGFILLEIDEFNWDYKKILKTCASIISNITKDIEISKIITMQVEALQDGITDIKDENLKILEADKAKNDFLANISHELRTPLNSIIGFSELLSNEFIGTLNKKQKEYVNDIQISGLHLLGMINEILDISKIEAHAMKMNKRIFAIQDAVIEVCNILKPIADKKDITIINDTESFEIFADYQKIQQILFNLVNNAVKFTPNNGKIVISAYIKEKNAIIAVQDNGIGIPKKYHKKIFEKFEQIDNSCISNPSSTGLGLTITRELIHLHGGTIKVESEINNGAKFIVILPSS